MPEHAIDHQAQPPPAPTALVAEEPSLGRWLSGHRRLAALWLDADYRRDGMRLLATGLRGMVGVRIEVALLLLAGAGMVILYTEVDAPVDMYRLLARLFGLATLIASAPLYASEQQQGTLELLWLATGSQKALLRLKIVTLLVGFTMMMVPTVLFSAWYQYWQLPVLPALFFLLTQSLLIVSVMALLGTYLPQPWAGGFVGAALLVPVFLAFDGVDNVFNPFLNPVGSQFGAPNRIIVLIVSALLLGRAAKRLKRCFG